MTEILHSLANYPKLFHGTVVSPTKICMQFEDVEVKLRYKQGGFYRNNEFQEKWVPISTTGTAIELTSVGCQMPVIEEVQAALIAAYHQYAELHMARYRHEYNKDFIDFLKKTHITLGNCIHFTEQMTREGK